MILTNNFAGLSCQYYAVGAPLTAVRHGVRSVATDRGELIAEGYGVMDRLSYRWDGMLLSEVTADANGQDFVGRTGFPLSGTGGGTASYGWNGAGLLNSDTSRGITRTTYNHLSLPTSVTFSDKSHVDYTYNAAGEVQTVTTYAMVAGAKRPVKVGQRSYCGDFVFEGDSLTEVNFAGCYFDGEGRPHFRHADWQGNVAIVTDRDGQIEQHNGYYPYGEPWREPTGQNRLFGGKERMRDGGLNDYDYVARRLNSATGIWAQPDPMARDFAATNPYVYCGANPIKFIDPTGKATFLTYQNKKISIVGTDGKNDDRVFIVNKRLAKSIARITEQGGIYQGAVENNKKMAEIPSSDDMEAIETLNNNSNTMEVELGMHKSYDGKLVMWDPGTAYDENEPDKPREIEPFKVDGKVAKAGNLAVWEVHTHPILTKKSNTERGYGIPSGRDKSFNKDAREKGFKGSSMVVGGEDKNISFYYGGKTIVTLPISDLIEFLKKLNIKSQNK